MEKPKSPFSLRKRPTKHKNRFIYYVQFRDRDGNYTSALSSGQTSKSAASAWATEYLKQGHVPTQRGFTFERYSKDRWIWARCAYIKTDLPGSVVMINSYDHVPLLVSRLDVPVSLDHLLQRIASVDHRFEITRLSKVH